MPLLALSTNPGLPNLAAGWTGILLGMLSGMVLGMFFHRENWLGGYASLPRRMYRLGHVSLFALGAINILFALTIRWGELTGPFLRPASWTLLIGAVAMPVCCVAMAVAPRTRPLFAVPVLALLIGTTLTLLEVIRT